jgi:ParB family chromosome partitioning protein
MKLAADIERVALDKVEVGVRRRQKLGNLKSLARSIEQHGLLHPILVRNGNQLVAGQRRLEACRLLGWPTIPARRVDGLSDDELRAVELEENTERLDLLDYETSKARLAEIRQAEAEAKREAENRGDSPQYSRKGGRGKKAPGSRREVAERTGVSPRDQGRLERHVEIAEQYPFMQKPEWKQYNVLEAAERLEDVPERERADVVALIDQPGIPPKKAIQIIGHVAEMKPAERKEVFALAKSHDAMDRRMALTKAAELPPPADPGLVNFVTAARTVRDGARNTRIAWARPKAEAIAVGLDKLVTKMRGDRS